jgi:hypothetical protein
VSLNSADGAVKKRGKRKRERERERGKEKIQQKDK